LNPRLNYLSLCLYISLQSRRRQVEKISISWIASMINFLISFYQVSNQTTALFKLVQTCCSGCLRPTLWPDLIVGVVWTLSRISQFLTFFQDAVSGYREDTHALRNTHCSILLLGFYSRFRSFRVSKIATSMDFTILIAILTTMVWVTMQVPKLVHSSLSAVHSSSTTTHSKALENLRSQEQ
jgi:hypothetical protein